MLNGVEIMLWMVFEDKMRPIRLLTILFTTAVLLTAQETTESEERYGSSHPADNSCLMRLKAAKHAGFPVIISAHDFYKKAIHRVTPKVPSSCRCEGAVTVRLLVDEKGELSCLEPGHGHPLLVLFVVEAVRQWRFEPLLRRGELVPFIGQVTVRFSTSGVQVSGQ
jgi:hypothetical protein